MLPSARLAAAARVNAARSRGTRIAAAMSGQQRRLTFMRRQGGQLASGALGALAGFALVGGLLALITFPALG
jgi:hypothetical protein